ncbi:hypothetical protein [Chryseobacterium sp. JK1]|uniref:hypothetical protein n=1 Tax=Chryseobacterium sp. JK1 TaxID=874294 RepID=UPI003D681A40
MKNIYRDYNEEEMLIAYLDYMDHTGKINEEMEEMIRQKFDYNEFVKKAEHKRALIKERGRISFEVYNRVKEGKSLDEIFETISSDLVDAKELEHLMVTKFNTFSLHKENTKIDTKTVYRSLLGVLVASVTGFLFFFRLVDVLKETSFLLLIPVYIFNYYVIKFITGKTRDNLIVFIAVFISVILSTILPFVLMK